MRRPSRTWLRLAPAVLCVGAALPAQDPVRFNRDIRPLLSTNCFPCHGADAQARKADLRLDTLAGLTTAREGRFPVVPGDPDASELLRRVTSDDEKIVMPPPDSHLELEQGDAALLRRWIEQGAPFEDHWAFVTPQTPDVPRNASSTNEADDWARTDVDRFVLRKLQAAGLEPQPDADRATLIRRLTLDLTGLPPTPERIDAFVADPRPDAYEQLVEELLASPHFGERMAQKWLDIARYADTNGYHHDNTRTSWPYRDWVINAFNGDMPYDTFVTQQLAGDLLDDAGQSELVASAFCRMHNINDEGGAIDAEYRVEAIADRIETIGTAFMGLTMTCARCHDHKYDPLTQEDYYSLYAIFGSIDERGVYSNNFSEARAYPARIGFRTPELEQQTEQAQSDLQAVLARLEAVKPEVERERIEWEQQLRARHGLDWIDAAEAVSTDAGEVERLADGSALLRGAPAKTSVEFTFRTTRADLRVLCLEALTDPSLTGGGIAPSSNGNAVVTAVRAEVSSTADPSQSQTVTWQHAWADHAQTNSDYDVGNLVHGGGNGWALAGHERKGSRTALLVATEPFGFEGGAEIRVTIECRSQYAAHVLGRARVSLAATTSAADALAADLPIDRSDWWMAGPFRNPPENAPGNDPFRKLFAHDFGPEQATALDPAQRFGKVSWKHRGDVTDGNNVILRGERSVWYWARTLRVPTERQLEIRLGSDDGVRAWLNGKEIVNDPAQRGVQPDQNRVTVTASAGENLLLVKIVNSGGPGGFNGRVDSMPDAPGKLDPAAWLPDTRRAVDLNERVTRLFGRRSPTFAKLDAERSAAEQKLTELEASAVPMLVMKELPEPKPTVVLRRGRYDLPDASRPVRRRPPTVLGGEFPAGAKADRLGFAQWLTAPDHPLTARVHVNRLWELLFGTGIVATSENFGVQAEWPSHPELLDFLATTFVRDGWSQKRLLRRLVTSSTYRQRADHTETATRRDPANRLLAHFPRRRLDAEFVRDTALFASGLLRADEIGGPSVKPYQPAGLWREVSIGGSSNTQVFRADTGAALYRRSLYTFWKRTSPSPQMLAFDAPTREFCVVRRAATNTPLQALTLWNDVQFVEAARVLAQRVLGEADTDELRIERLFLHCTGRRPDNDDRAVLERALATFRNRYSNDAAAAGKLLEVGESPVDERWPATEQAAWTMLASAVLNLDETLVRD